MEVEKNPERSEYFKEYYQVQCEQGTLSAYGKFHLRNLGYNFYNTRTKETLTKGQFFDRYGDAWIPGIIPIEFIPSGGWGGSADRRRHFEIVKKTRVKAGKLNLE